MALHDGGHIAGTVTIASADTHANAFGFDGERLTTVHGPSWHFALDGRCKINGGESLSLDAAGGIARLPRHPAGARRRFGQHRARTSLCLSRGMGMSGIGLPSLTAANASARREKMSMATQRRPSTSRDGGQPQS
ncbi:hypothetical protein [Paraburkholderia silvatlantica]|uniref:Uncharacterized protein n=3 Tax=cellular organisms TaxID=131567 RepID=W2TID3_NECAM|nr:hypothetical protein [Paraburkholderia silvatlantica]XP_013303810.1 hypothetical protein NECAME_17877 [Necator americanus]ETN81583.1 hypothetical protein NECAME_17877 [Necator americanus]MBB2928099.1 hypothetical protein [Paraburkholderia silvatlantica]